MSFKIGSPNLKAVTAKLARYQVQVVEQGKQAIVRSAERTYQTTLSGAPRRTGFMADHLRLNIRDDQLAYSVGFHADDFKSAGKDFYPIFSLFGARSNPGHDFLFAPYRAERARLRQELKAAVKPK